MILFGRYGTGVGFAIVMSIILVGVLVFTIISLRKQVSRREDEERRRANKKKKS